MGWQRDGADNSDAGFVSSLDEMSYCCPPSGGWGRLRAPLCAGRTL